MHAEVETIDDRSDWQHIERIHEFFIDLLVVEHQHLLAEVKRLGHISRLVVTSQQENVVRIFEL